MLVVRGQGHVVRLDIERYLDAIVVRDLLPYAKLVDLSDCRLRLDEHDLMMLGARIRAYMAVQYEFGPLALVVRSRKDEFAARLYATLADADRPLRIFLSRLLASDWLKGVRPQLTCPGT